MKSFIVRSLKRPLGFTLGVLILLSLQACQTIETRGQFIDNSALAQLESSAPNNPRLNKMELINLIGTPTIIPAYSPNTWYYVERIMSQRAWFSPKVVQQKIVKVTFGSDNSVNEIVVIDDSHKQDIEVISEYTKTYGTELNGIQKFFKNLGKFNKTSKTNKNKASKNKKKK